MSNYVETEQIVLYDGPQAKQVTTGQKQLSFVQTRGSIPVFWAQIINLKYTPRLWIGESRKSVRKMAKEAHLVDLDSQA